MKPAELRVLFALLASLVLVLGTTGCGDDGDDDDDMMDAGPGDDAGPGVDGGPGEDGGPECLAVGEACTAAADCCSDACYDLNGTTDGEDDPQCVTEALGAVWESFETSLHRTRAGKPYFYEGTAEDPGFFTDTGVEYDTLACGECHRKGTTDPTKALLADGTEIDLALYEPTCADCHADPYDPSGDVDSATCLGCHGRQNAEVNLSNSPNPVIAARFQDVHRNNETNPFDCVDCHVSEQFHGDGTEYDSFLQRRPIGCQDCHVDGGSAGPIDMTTAEHMTHASGDALVQCTACHSKSVATCYSCHFRSEADADRKTFFGPPPLSGFVFLVNDARTGGGVTVASYQSLAYDDETFAAFAPFYGHTVGGADTARTCDDCHGATNMTDYTAGEEYRITTWTPPMMAGEAGTVAHRQGVIPIPPDWRDVYEFDFVTSDVVPPMLPDYRLAEDPDGRPGFQMLEEFATPLTADQMEALQTDYTP